MTTGIEPNMAAAISCPQKKTSPTCNAFTTPTATGSFDEERIKVNAYRYSCQDRVKAKKKTETMPGSTNGKSIIHIACKRLAPSIRAASANS